MQGNNEQAAIAARNAIAAEFDAIGEQRVLESALPQSMKEKPERTLLLRRKYASWQDELRAYVLANVETALNKNMAAAEWGRLSVSTNSHTASDRMTLAGLTAALEVLGGHEEEIRAFRQRQADEKIAAEDGGMGKLSFTAYLQKQAARKREMDASNGDGISTVLAVGK